MRRATLPLPRSATWVTQAPAARTSSTTRPMASASLKQGITAAIRSARRSGRSVMLGRQDAIGLGTGFLVHQGEMVKESGPAFDQRHRPGAEGDGLETLVGKLARELGRRQRDEVGIAPG